MLRSDEIAFRVSDPSLDAEVATKATAVTSLSSFNVSAVTGSAESETAVWTNVSFSGNNDAGYKADKWWPAEDASYRFYASNSALTFAASGATVAATNATDVICAYAAAPSYKAKNTLSFEHIFARLGAVTVSAATGYTISNVSIKITPKTGGTYNLLTGAGHTDGTGWSGLATGSETVIASATGSNANDIYLVPGTYTLTASWTAARGLYTENIQNMQVDVNLTAGKINTISTTLSGNAKEVVFNVSIAPWTEQNQVVEFPTVGPLCFEILTSGNIVWTVNTSGGPSNKIQYSKDQITWTEITSSIPGATIPVTAGEKIYFKGDLTRTHDGTFRHSCFQTSSGATFNASGTPMSLLHNRELSTYGLYGLFYNCVGIISAQALSLPATTLAQYCYGSMFSGCTALTSTPALPAMTLASNCYGSMFNDCTSLITAPELPATTLASGCYSSMFRGCTSLTTAPELPATTLYATCYSNMFINCTSLTTAPELPATTLANYCYMQMFQNCSSLNYVKCLSTNGDSGFCGSWLASVKSSGTFIKASGAVWASGQSGIPDGWTVIEE